MPFTNDNEEELRIFLESVPNYMAISDADFRLKLITKSFAAEFNAVPGALIGKYWLELPALKEEMDIVMLNAKKAVLEKKSMFFEQSFQFPKRRLYVNYSFTPVFKEGRIYRIVSVITDITSMKRLQDERAKLMDMLAHDLKTPVTAIKLQNSLCKKALLAREHSVLEKVDKLLNSQQQSISKLENVMQDALDITLIQEGKMTMRTSLVRVEALIREAVALLTPLAGSKSITLAINAASETELNFDNNKMQRVLSNLISNAIKFTPRCGVITVSLFETADTVTFEIKDTGVGISPASLPYVFKPYWKGDHLHHGSGLGLAIVKEIIDLHKGSIQINSKLGVGTTVLVAIPRS